MTIIVKGIVVGFGLMLLLFQSNNDWIEGVIDILVNEPNVIAAVLVIAVTFLLMFWMVSRMMSNLTSVLETMFQSLITKFDIYLQQQKTLIDQNQVFINELQRIKDKGD